jgi:sugar diacid utilization regulator
MMKWETLRERLSRTLHTPFTLERFPKAKWPRMKTEKVPLRSFVDGTKLYFWLSEMETHMEVLAIEVNLISEREQELVFWILQEQGCTPHTSHSTVSQLSQLITQQFQNGDISDLSIPKEIIKGLHIPKKAVPIWIQPRSEQSLNGEELQRILESFIEGKSVVVNVESYGCLLIVADNALDLDSDESERISLMNFSSAIQGMLVSELGLEVDITAELPILVETQLLTSVYELRQTVLVGRQFYPQSYIHMPWDLHVENLLAQLPQSFVQQFVKNVGHQVSNEEDEEMQVTIEAFFAANCNVSETAKRLFIHRNTLLYRLDRFKQETGYDIRNFQDAVFIRILMLLDKVTKTN